MPASPPLDSLGRTSLSSRRAGLPGRAPPRSKGRRYPADPPRTEEIIAVMRCAVDGLHGARTRGLIVILWRARLRIQEALDLTELDLDRRRGSVLVRRGKGGRRREVGMDDWGFEQLEPCCTRASRCRSVPCSASPTAARAVAHGTPRRRAQRCVVALPEPECAGALPRTNSPTRTRWTSYEKGCR